MSGLPDYYRILGVSPLATKREIKRAFRRMALRHHPDHNPDSGQGDEFLLVNEAHEVLSHEGRRAKYDRERRAAGFQTSRDDYRERSSRPGRARSQSPRRPSPEPWSMRSVWSAYRAESRKPFREWRAGPDPRAVRGAAVWGGLSGTGLGFLFGMLFLGVAGMNWAAALLGGCAGLAGGILGAAMGAAFHAFGPNVGFSAGAILGIIGSIFTAGLLLLFVDPYPQVSLNGILSWGTQDAAGAFMYSLFLASAMAGAGTGALFSYRAYAS